MSAGFGSPLWLLGIGQGQPSAGFNSPLLPLGISAPPSDEKGYHSLLALWCGGAGTTAAGAGYHSPLAFWCGGAGTTEGEQPPEPQPEPPFVGGGGGIGPRPRPRTQHARLHPWESRDEFGRLIARRALPRTQFATLRPYLSPELYGKLAAHATYRAQFVPVDHGTEYGTLDGLRGLPNRALLAFILTELWKR